MSLSLDYITMPPKSQEEAKATQKSLRLTV